MDGEEAQLISVVGVGGGSGDLAVDEVGSVEASAHGSVSVG